MLIGIIKNFVIFFFTLVVVLLSKSAWAEVEIAISGTEETVFDWTTDRCETEDIPDVPARAFRDAEGNVQLIASHFNNRRMIGLDLNSLVQDCNVIMYAEKNADPAKYSDREWIHSVYTTDGMNIYALIHNEYQGSGHEGMCPSGDHLNCWHNSITSAFSTDMGKTYSHAPGPAHRVANVPYKHSPDINKTYGMYSPSNIIHNQKDGYYYSMMHLEAYGVQEWGVGVMRTKTLNDPASWRCWGGAEFNVSFVDPYTEMVVDPADHVCAPVARDNIERMSGSLTYNTYLKKYLLVDAASRYDSKRGEVVHGFYFSLSSDLIYWSPRKLIMETELWWTSGNDVDRLGTPSLIDPDDSSRNFEYTDREVYLYFTRWHAGNTYDRDLVRIPIKITKNELAPAPGAIMLLLLR